MKNTMKLIALLIAVIAVATVAFTACNETADFTVGILQPIKHDALGAANKGFQEELTRLMTEAGKTVKYVDQNAQGNASTQVSIINGFVASGVDLMLTIGTDATKTAQGIEKYTPILFTAVTDPAGAGIVSSNGSDREASNVSGTSDMNPVALQMQLCKDLGMTKVALLYTSSEDNSRIQIEMAKAECTRIGLDFVEKSVTDSNAIKNVMTTIALDETIDGIYIPTDNNLAANVANIHAENKSGNKLPIVCGEEGMNKACGVATYSIDYYELGNKLQRWHLTFLWATRRSAKCPLNINQAIPSFQSIKPLQRSLASTFLHLKHKKQILYQIALKIVCNI
ncbi:MAG: ABC transporter substrate-binding protein [Clostridia bacterium]|nr:ABC transporter substrate-binding protein [Clostridia bacterium]